MRSVESNRKYFHWKYLPAVKFIVTNLNLFFKILNSKSYWFSINQLHKITMIIIYNNNLFLFEFIKQKNWFMIYGLHQLGYLQFSHSIFSPFESFTEKNFNDDLWSDFKMPIATTTKTTNYYSSKCIRIDALGGSKHFNWIKIMKKKKKNVSMMWTLNSICLVASLFNHRFKFWFPVCLKMFAMLYGMCFVAFSFLQAICHRSNKFWPRCGFPKTKKIVIFIILLQSSGVIWSFRMTEFYAPK